MIERKYFISKWFYKEGYRLFTSLLKEGSFYKKLWDGMIKYVL